MLERTAVIFSKFSHNSLDVRAKMFVSTRPLGNKKWACVSRHRPLKFPPVQNRSNDYLPATLLFS